MSMTLNLLRMVLDRAGGLTRVERMKLLTELKKARASIDGGALKRIERMKLIMRMKEIRALLTDATTPETADADPNAAVLREVADGKHDGLELGPLLDKIEAALIALRDAGKLEGATDALGERAIEHWARMVPVAV